MSHVGDLIDSRQTKNSRVLNLFFFWIKITRTPPKVQLWVGPTMGQLGILDERTISSVGIPQLICHIKFQNYNAMTLCGDDAITMKTGSEESDLHPLKSTVNFF